MDLRLRELARRFHEGDNEAGTQLAIMQFKLAQHPLLTFILQLLSLTEMHLKYIEPIRRSYKIAEEVYTPITIAYTYGFEGIYHVPNTEQFRRTSLYLRIPARILSGIENPIESDLLRSLKPSEMDLFTRDEYTLIDGHFYMRTQESDPGYDNVYGAFEFGGAGTRMLHGRAELAEPDPFIKRADVDKPYIKPKEKLRQSRRITLFAWGNFSEREYYQNHPEKLLSIMAHHLRKPEEDIIDALIETKGNVTQAARLLNIRGGMSVFTITPSQLSRMIKTAGLEEELKKIRE